MTERGRGWWWGSGAGLAVIGLAVIGLAGCGLAEAAKKPELPPGPPPLFRMHFIDVGQGSATLLEFPCGAMLVDTGGEDHSEFHSTERLMAYLDAFFARRSDLGRRLESLVLTHPHIDHVRGVPAVLNRFAVANVVHNGQTGTVEEAVSAGKTLRDYLARPDTAREEVVAGDTERDFLPPRTSPVIDPFTSCKGVDPAIQALWGHVRRDPGWGEDNYGKAEYDDENNHSVVLRVDFGATSLLITGDLEAPAIGTLLELHGGAPGPGSPLDADVYLVGHHGSHNGTTAGLLAALTPEWAVMGVGSPDRKHAWTAWQYGHPRAVTVELLEQGVTSVAPPREVMVGTGQKTFVPEQIDRAILATGWDGTIVLEGDTLGNIRRGAPDAPPAPDAPGAP